LPDRQSQRRRGAPRARGRRGRLPAQARPRGEPAPDHSKRGRHRTHTKERPMKKSDPKQRRMAPLQTPNDLGAQAAKDVAAGLNLLLADVFGLYLKPKNFHWHMSGPHFRDYHLLLDEQADQIYATTDPIAERVRKLGSPTLRSIGQIQRLQRVLDNDADF